MKTKNIVNLYILYYVTVSCMFFVVYFYIIDFFHLLIR